MYEIRCIVGDKRLREVLVFLHNGNTLEHPVVIPVLDNGHPEPLNVDVTKPIPALEHKPSKPAKKKRKSPLQHGGRHLKGMGATEVVRDLIRKTGRPNILAREMSDATLAVGYSKGAYSHAIKLLLAEKVIRRTSVPGEYIITSANS